MTKNFKLHIAYDGTNYHGWQIQVNNKTVQGELEKILNKFFTDQKISLIGSGRTDSGVHALGQVANIRVDTVWETETLKNALNANLEDDIWIQEVTEVDHEFHSRFSAKHREYEYSITTEYSPITRNSSWWIKYDLELDLLHYCADLVKNANDFTRFCKATAEVANKQCTILESFWEIEKHSVVYRVKANRFLQHMVRFLGGTMIEVARGRLKKTEFKKMLNAEHTKISVIRAPANGLCLKNIGYR